MKADPKIESPPAKGNKDIQWDWNEIAAKVRAADGEWVFLNDGLGPVPTSLRYALERGGMTAMRPPEDFEYTTRNNTPPPNRTCDIYVRIKKEN